MERDMEKGVHKTSSKWCYGGRRGIYTLSGHIWRLAIGRSGLQFFVKSTPLPIRVGVLFDIFYEVMLLHYRRKKLESFYMSATNLALRRVPDRTPKNTGPNVLGLLTTKWQRVEECSASIMLVNTGENGILDR